MDLSIFLAKVIGWYFVIVSIFLLARPQVVRSVMEEILAQRALIFFIGIVTLIVGLLLVVSHNVWVMGWPVIVTIIAWIILIAGIVRLAFPELASRGANWWLKNSTYLIWAAIVYLIIGLYLLYKAYF